MASKTRSRRKAQKHWLLSQTFVFSGACVETLANAKARERMKDRGAGPLKIVLDENAFARSHAHKHFVSPLKI
jgi:hypothetical protein